MSITLSDLMNPSILRSLYERRTAVALEGPPGIGKTSVLRLWPKLLSEMYGEEFGCVLWDAPTVEYPDIRGVCFLTKDSEGRPTSTYAYPALMPPRDYLKKHPRGLMIVDEFASSDHSVQKASASLLYEQRMGDEELPDGWMVVTASNGVQHKSGALKPLLHLVNRVCTLKVRPDVDSLVNWLEEQHIHPFAPAFVRERPDVVFSEKLPDEPKPFCTPRSFTATMRFIANRVGDELRMPTDDVSQQIVAGDIGDGAAAALFGWAKIANDLPTIEEIKRDPLKAKVPGPDKLAAAHVAVQLLVHCMNEANTDKLWLYAQRLPKELQVSAAVKLMNRRDGYLLNSPEFSKWIAANRALIVSSRP